MRNMKKGLSVTIVFILIFSMGLTAFAELIDVETHWANQEISYFIERGILNGYPDGTFKPENNVTKAEVYKIINRVMGFIEASEINFLDVNENDWFYNDVTKGVKAGYITEKSGQYLMPNIPASREEVAEIIGLAFRLTNRANSTNYFLDEKDISEQAKGYVDILSDKGYISGYPDGTFRPRGQITRAEVVKMINNITGKIVNTAGILAKNIEENLLINTGDVVLNDMQIKGDLYLTEGIGNGDVTLDNVIVKGETFIRGGGENSIIIKNSTLGKVTIDKKDGNIRVVVEGNKKIGEIVLEDNAVLVVKDGAKVGTVVAASKAEIQVEKGAAIEKLEVNANDVEVSVKGEIGLVVANEKVTINDKMIIKGTEVKVSSSDNIEEPKKEESNKNSGGGGGGVGGGGTGGTTPTPSPDPDVAVTAITVTGTGGATSITTNKGTLQMIETVAPANASNKAVKWSVENGTGTATISSTGLLKAISDGTVTVKAISRSTESVSGTLVITITNQMGEEATPIVEIGNTITKDGLSVTIEKVEYNEDNFIPDDSGSTSIYPKGFGVYYKIENYSDEVYKKPNLKFKLEELMFENEVNSMGYSHHPVGIGSSYIYPGEALIGFYQYSFNRDININEIEVIMPKDGYYPQETFGKWLVNNNDDYPDVAVTAITVTGTDGATSITTNKGTLQMIETVAPANASNKAVKWSVENGTGSATISSTGLLKAISDGTVTVKAISRSTESVSGTLVITITNQVVEESTPIVEIGNTITKDGLSVTIEKVEYNEDNFRPDDPGSTNIYPKGFGVYFRIENNSGEVYRLPNIKFKIEPYIYEDELNGDGYSIHLDNNFSSYIYQGEAFTGFYQYSFNRDININEIEVIMPKDGYYPQETFGKWIVN